MYYDLACMGNSGIVEYGIDSLMSDYTDYVNSCKAYDGIRSVYFCEIDSKRTADVNKMSKETSIKSEPKTEVVKEKMEHKMKEKKHFEEYNKDEEVYGCYSLLRKKIKPYVKVIVDSYKYEGSPINDGVIDKETLAQLVDRVIEAVSYDLEEIRMIYHDKEDFVDGECTKWELLTNLVEVLILTEIYK